ncbi:hypothetical protein CCC_00696 [Paramagnetospirillum magnetotacticum MS-1]|uniref:UPF0235 protein CCC_00696 n=1 Tax=Paramagnetospirillum magnetotacticum MS-1 TaxID=272627 RepID=A0A0C2YSG0_PARME|nr:DUF167 family protein [Paramagnetospirillum magnetotacticum]KIL97635.1 hypothetical protein CCC_00696 [Paramagnetospirillum magnetotacticum MS-1]
MSPSPFTACAAGLKVAVRLTPKASRDRIMGAAPEADGSVVLKAQVTTVPEDGKANAALLKLLSKAWKIPKSDMDIVLGATDRRKVILISGDSEVLRKRLDEWMASNHD